MPFVAVREAYLHIRAGAGEMQRSETFAVQPCRALGEIGVMLRPRRDRIGQIHPRGGEDGVGKPADRFVFRHIRKDLLCPRRVGIGDDVPVDVEIGNLLQRRLVCRGVGLVGAGNLGRVLFGQQHGVVAGNRQPRCAIGISLCHALIKPAGSQVEIGVTGVAIARKRDFFIGIKGGDQSAIRQIGVFGQKSHQRQGCQRRCNHQILVLLQLQADLDGDFGQFFEFDGIDGRNGHDLPSSISIGGADHSPFLPKAKCFQACPPALQSATSGAAMAFSAIWASRGESLTCRPRCPPFM
ncbi:hypothetical protein D3C72_1321110 [compost metagenome]